MSVQSPPPATPAPPAVSRPRWDPPAPVAPVDHYDRATDGQNSAEGAVLAVPYGVQDTAFPTPLATAADVGSVWGVAYQPVSNSVYVSSFLKRHAG